PLALDTDSSILHFYLGEVLYNRGLNDDALTALKRAMELNPENHDALYLMGFVLGDMGRHEEAREITKRAIKLNPTLSRAQANLSLEQSRARYEDAVAARDERRSREMQVAGEGRLAHYNLGIALYHRGDVERALAALRGALEAQPSFVKARLNLALLFYKGKRLQLTLESYRQALSNQPEHPVAWNGIGLVLTDLKKHEDARNAFARAIQARPSYAEAHYNLSFTLSSLGDFEGALRETKLALELEPYYVAQKFELAIDLQHEDPDLSIQPEIGTEKRADEPIADFTFDAKLLDTLFTELAPAPAPSPLPAGSGERTPEQMAAD